ncbi:MAG: cobalt-precorrin-5B (C(1))-methyltransferase CbiD [Syntrophobacteraceae bacterium]
MSSLRGGFTTGTCAAAAAKAATMLLLGESTPSEVEVILPDGTRERFTIIQAERSQDTATAAVRKDAGDDPDVTHAMLVTASVSWLDGDAVLLVAGDGVGTVTKHGLSVLPGEPAINPVPRRMIQSEVRRLTARGVRVVLSIPGGTELAMKTFNPRLGVVGGLSILGTTGRVRPYSCPALRESLQCVLKVAVASGVVAPVFVPGHFGERAARKHFCVVPEQVVEVGNEWGFMLDCIADYDLAGLLVLGHPGKLAKLTAGQWDTHSSRSKSPVPIVAGFAEQLLKRPLRESQTVEGLFAVLPLQDRQRLAECLAGLVRQAVVQRIGGRLEVAVALVNMQAELLGCDGDFGQWR